MCQASFRIHHLILGDHPHVKAIQISLEEVKHISSFGQGDLPFLVFLFPESAARRDQVTPLSRKERKEVVVFF